MNKIVKGLSRGYPVFVTAEHFVTDTAADADIDTARDDGRRDTTT